MTIRISNFLIYSLVVTVCVIRIEQRIYFQGQCIEGQFCIILSLCFIHLFMIQLLLLPLVFIVVAIVVVDVVGGGIVVFA